ncbi:Excalibur calcium-binding domain-containing protein [Lentzea xinjiangensis]|uniref:Excalibur calcium-binding domain-containing protein n=1 Tax=Lentzea xinjiangensis TaxID=402600 RepID=A0A1H9EYB2_9PSEU|nr:excalibur calcium-binding domain-containing protein [Lentzea xinjiangensis]SEQ30714.1 Excalibur calcium-binding domain-containing protein [Lentzea xinjiangensis]
MSGWRTVGGGVLLVVLTAGCGAQAQQSTPIAVEKPAEDVPVSSPTSVSVPPAQLGISVTSIVDGRSVLLSDGSKAEVGGLAQPGACWAEAAASFAKSMLLNQQVRYDRTTGALSLADGTDYALLALGNGAARTAGTPTAAQAEAEGAAQRVPMGLWGPPCGGKDATETPAPPPPPPPAPVPTTAKPKPTTTTTQPGPRQVFYASCDEARRAGAAPLHWGQPGYRVELDENRNGIACEYRHRQ